MRLLNKILSLAASAAIMFTGYSTPASAQTDPASSSEAIADIQNTDVHFVKIAAGWEHSVALDSQGHAWEWGEDYNKLEEITKASYIPMSIYPARVNTDVKFVDIASSLHTSFGIDEEGYLWQWGIKDFGRLTGRTSYDRYPERISSDVKFKSVSASEHAIVAVDIDGRVWVWDYEGFSGKVESDIKIASISAGSAGSFLASALDEEGHLYDLSCHRKDESNVQSELTCSLNRVEFGKKISQISIRYSNNGMLLDEDGYIWAKGRNRSGEVGDGTYEDRNDFVRVKTDKKFTQVSARANASFAISQDGELYSWGSNACQQLGGGELDEKYRSYRNIPGQIKTDKKFRQVFAGITDTIFAIDEYGISWGWGWNFQGAAGVGSKNGFVAEPARIAINVKFTQISASGNLAVALDTDGRIWIWGSYKRCGYDNKCSEYIAGGLELEETFEKKCVKVSVGDKHVLALDSDGHVWGWGSNQEGQLVEKEAGGEDWSPRNLFAGTEYADLVFTDIYAGATSSMAVDSNGNTWQWGTGEAETPKSVDSGNDPGMPNTGLNFVQTAVGRDHVLCLDESGVIWSWGKDDYGQLGQRTYGKYCIPGEGDKCQIDVRHLYDVAGRKYQDAPLFSQIAAGDGFSVALDTEGRIWTWGRNDKGQLGNYVSASKRETPGYVFR